jgi:hypothetical protein
MFCTKKRSWKELFLFLPLLIASFVFLRSEFLQGWAFKWWSVLEFGLLLVIWSFVPTGYYAQNNRGMNPFDSFLLCVLASLITMIFLAFPAAQQANNESLQIRLTEQIEKANQYNVKFIDFQKDATKHVDVMFDDLHERASSMTKEALKPSMKAWSNAEKMLPQASISEIRDLLELANNKLNRAQKQLDGENNPYKVFNWQYQANLDLLQWANKASFKRSYLMGPVSEGMDPMQKAMFAQLVYKADYLNGKPLAIGVPYPIKSLIVFYNAGDVWIWVLISLGIGFLPFKVLLNNPYPNRCSRRY